MSATPRKVWSGTISFGLINIPVGLAVAAKTETVSFSTLHAKCNATVKQTKSCSSCGDEITADNSTKGYEVSKGTYIKVDPELLASLAPDKSRTIEITQFCGIEEVDPLLYDESYYLIPAEEAVQRKSYVLFREALEATGKVAIGSFVRNDREHLCVIRTFGDQLVLETLFYAEDIRANDGIDGLIDGITTSEAELGLATSLIDSLSEPFEHTEHVNGHRAAIRNLISDLADGKTVTVPDAPADTKGTVDLMDALKASVAAVQKTAPATKKKTTAAR